MRWVPGWIKQVLRGLSDGKDWLLDAFQALPLLVRVSGWVVFQAVLFKVQPWLWRGLTTLYTTAGTFGASATRTQLLLLIVGRIPDSNYRTVVQI